jgi:hypothetical protein
VVQVVQPETVLRWTSRVRAMGIRDRPISPGSPWQNGHAVEDEAVPAA